MKYFFVSLVFLLFSAVSASSAGIAVFAIIGKSRLVADTDTTIKKASITVGGGYGSDVQFFGRTGPIKYPYLNTYSIYNFKPGIFIYASGINVLGYFPIVDEVDLGAGYLFRYSKQFSGSISYTRFIFNKDAAYVIRSLSSNDINFKNTFDWKFAKSSVVFDYLFGKENDYFLTLNTSKYIETDWSIFDDKDFLSFNPTVSAILGTQNFVAEYASQARFRVDVDNTFIPGGGPSIPARNYNNGRFNALNYSIKLPIAYNRPHYTIEASWKYSVPVDVEGQLGNRHEVFFNLTFYYVFFK